MISPLLMDGLLAVPPPAAPDAALSAVSSSSNPRGRIAPLLGTSHQGHPDHRLRQCDTALSCADAPMPSSKVFSDRTNCTVVPSKVSAASCCPQLSSRSQSGVRDAQRCIRPQSPTYDEVVGALKQHTSQHKRQVAVPQAGENRVTLSKGSMSLRADVRDDPKPQHTATPTPLVAILNAQAKATRPEPTSEGSPEPYKYRSVPPPPPVGDVPAAPKLLTKYHFLKNFDVKPKTPGSHEKNRGRGGARSRKSDRHSGVSPLPVAPQPQVCAQSPELSVPTNDAVVVALAFDHSTNTHRTIPTLGAFAPVISNTISSVMAFAASEAAPACDSDVPQTAQETEAAVTALIHSMRGFRRHTIASAVPVVRAGLESAVLPTTPEAPRVMRRHNSTNGPLIPKRVFPLPESEPNVARNLMDDIIVATPEQPERSARPVLDDIRSPSVGATSVDDDEKELSFVGRVRPEAIEDDVYLSPRGHSTSLGATECRDSSSCGLLSPTTLGSSDHDDAVSPQSTACDESPASIAETVEGSAALAFDLDDDFGSDVSPVSDNEVLHDACGVREETSGTGAHDGGLASFFAETGIRSTLSQACGTQLTAEYLRVGEALLRDRAALFVAEINDSDSPLALVFYSVFMQKSEQLAAETYHRKLETFHTVGYLSCIALSVAMPALEAHGRRLVLMRRDLFMRAAVRQFIRSRPKLKKSVSSDASGGVAHRLAKFFSDVFAGDDEEEVERKKQTRRQKAYAEPSVGPKGCKQRRRQHLRTVAEQSLVVGDDATSIFSDGSASSTPRQSFERRDDEFTAL